MRGAAIALVALAVVLGPAGSASAGTTQAFTTSQSEFTEGTPNQGWWSATVSNNDTNRSYVASGGPGGSEQNFFTFDVRGLPDSCDVHAATLRVTRFEGSNTGVMTYGLWDVSTPPATLNRNEGMSPAIAADLSSGRSFGTFAVDSAGSLSPTEVLSLSLNAAGVRAVSAARGGFFSVGGALAASDNGYLFGFTNGLGTQQLVVGCVTSRHQARQECIFIRAAHGRRAFRALYGSGPRSRHAMRNCVDQRTGV